MPAEAERVAVHPHHSPPPPLGSLEHDAAKLRRFATMMDGQFEVAGVRFGYDALIGLVPGVGDVVTGTLGLYPLYLAKKHKLGGVLIARMLGNLAVDFVVGSVPLLGDLFDVAFKANVKNRELFEQAVAKRRDNDTF